MCRALTIHKAQGQTLEQVKVDVKKCFSAGMSVDSVVWMTRADKS